MSARGGSWPGWLDQAEQLVTRDRTCPDCYTVVDGVTVFAVFRGDGCDHADNRRAERTVCDRAGCGRSMAGLIPWMSGRGRSVGVYCSQACAER